MKTSGWIGLVLAVAGCTGDDGAADAGTGTDSGTSTAQSDSTGDPLATGPGDADATASSSGPGPATGSEEGSTTTPTATDSGSDSGSGDTGTESGSDGSSSGSTGAAACGRAITDLDSAVAILAADYPDPGGGSGGSGGSGSGGDSTTTGGPGFDPDTLRIRLSNGPLTCADPYGSYECMDGVDIWRVTINVPPEMVAPGSYDLADIPVSYSSVGMCGGGGGDGGGGGGVEGTLVIESIGPAGISACIQDTDFLLFDFDANGSFTAENCLSI